VFAGAPRLVGRACRKRVNAPAVGERILRHVQKDSQDRYERKEEGSQQDPVKSSEHEEILAN